VAKLFDGFSRTFPLVITTQRSFVASFYIGKRLGDAPAPVLSSQKGKKSCTVFGKFFSTRHRLLDKNNKPTTTTTTETAIATTTTRTARTTTVTSPNNQLLLYV